MAMLQGAKKFLEACEPARGQSLNFPAAGSAAEN
jgi:hypothetical protein